MRFYTAHMKPGSQPVLVREGFSCAAFLFGPFWLAAHRAWIPAVLALSAFVLAAALAPGRMAAILLAGLCWLMGLCGQDMRRWSLARRGFTLAQVVAARTAEDALHRLLLHRPELGAALA